MSTPFSYSTPITQSTFNLPVSVFLIIFFVIFTSDIFEWIMSVYYCNTSASQLRIAIMCCFCRVNNSHQSSSVTEDRHWHFWEFSTGSCEQKLYSFRLEVQINGPPRLFLHFNQLQFNMRLTVKALFTITTVFFVNMHMHNYCTTELQHLKCRIQIWSLIHIKD